MTTSNPAQIKLVLTAVFLAYLAQMTLNPIIAPLSREVGLAEWQVGVTISTAAIMVVLTARCGDAGRSRWGRKRVLLGALTLAAVATHPFAIVAQVGMIGADRRDRSVRVVRGAARYRVRHRDRGCPSDRAGLHRRCHHR